MVPLASGACFSCGPSQPPAILSCSARACPPWCGEQRLPLKLPSGLICSTLSLLHRSDVGDTLVELLVRGLSVPPSVDDANKPHLDGGFIFLSESSAKAARGGGSGDASHRKHEKPHANGKGVPTSTGLILPETSLVSRASHAQF